ncbi:MAG: hypothetical protein J3Q66DRAFT_170144 [Benniella sp.]|nr:MAG: hypothetical protein J3Q66DRAFT_170144 [Benniella sp.]
MPPSRPAEVNVRPEGAIVIALLCRIPVRVEPDQYHVVLLSCDPTIRHPCSVLQHPSVDPDSMSPPPEDIDTDEACFAGLPNEKARMMLHNASLQLGPRGVFIGTTPDAYWMVYARKRPVLPLLPIKPLIVSVHLVHLEKSCLDEDGLGKSSCP